MSAPTINWRRLAKAANDRIAADGVTPRVFNEAVRLKPRNWQSLTRGSTVPAADHLRLCQYLGLDPVTQAEPAAGMPAFMGDISWPNVALVLFANRQHRGLSVREAAAAIGISTATLSTAESGRKVAAGSLLKICAWVDRHPNELTAAPASGTNENPDSNENRLLDHVSPVKHPGVKHSGVDRRGVS